MAPKTAPHWKPYYARLPVGVHFNTHGSSNRCSGIGRDHLLLFIDSVFLYQEKKIARVSAICDRSRYGADSPVTLAVLKFWRVN